ncbi:chaoptin-like [Diabrotica virgifera virgifera]|uniref:Chaoptin-like n=1 Tax=Diabrotica virgifera virgifera TaxID=50390 RepID=A0ABM5JMD7_DIAVI|nr:chaoptin-like [Diabrotica virgifera virgifera]XP_050499104.1 chaoptin-like [Diabrotica virgifera virgifera]
MIGFLVLVSVLPALSLCGGCNYSYYIVHCQGIIQDDFVMELLRNKDFISDLKEIVIEDSDFSSIQPFVNISTYLYPARVDISSLTIIRSKVDGISNDTFRAFDNLKKLNLSNNNITNLVWVTSLFIYYNNYLDLYLSYNRISELDFNNFRQQMSSIWLNNNEISILKPVSDPSYRSFKFLDLSHNKLVSFSEFECNINIRSLNLSYNYLQSLELRSSKDLLRIEGHGNSNISYIGTSNSYSVSNFYSSFIPNNSLSIYNIFKLNWLDTDMPVLDSNKLPSISSAGTIDFSNNNLTSIPPNYFQFVKSSVFNLSLNNFDVISNTVFGVNSIITSIDLSFSNIKKISKNFFINCCSISYSSNLNLSGNALEELDGICNIIPRLKHLDLSFNKITNLSQISVSNCSYISSYNISNNFINVIPPGTFHGDEPIEYLDISENNLLFINESTFRNLKSSLKNISLSKNNILTIGSKSFHDFDELKTIDLSENKIKDIEEFAFSNLKNIDTINLSSNAIELLESYTFNNTSVKNIDLQGNPVHYIREKAFSNLYYLETLNLSNSAIAILENDVFFSLPKIRTIDLSNNYIFLLNNYTFRNLPVRNIYLYGNKIENISQNAFDNLQDLEYLDLSNLGISKIDPYAFNKMNNLIEVNLKNNNIQGLEKYTFHMVNIRTLFLNSISSPIILDNTVEINTLLIQLTGTIDEQFISSVFLKNLTIIDSYIELLKNNCFDDLPLLKSLNLINTTIDVFEDDIFSGLTSLTYLDASQFFQNKTSLKEYTFKDMRNLEVLNISNSALDTIENNAFAGLSKLKELNLERNKLSSINQSTFQPLNVETLNLSRNKLTNVTLTAITNDLPNLITLNLSSSSIRNVYTSELENPNRVEYLDLSNNYITNLDSQTFRSFKDLVKLYLHSNELSTIKYETFNYTKNLQTLRLDNNKITFLNAGVFDGLESLLFLNISNNENLLLQYGFVPFQTLRYLHTLYLDNTHLTRTMIDLTNFRKTFPYLSKIGINDNQLSCSELFDMMLYFDDYKIDYTPYNPKFYEQNLNGITCST